MVVVVLMVMVVVVALLLLLVAVRRAAASCGIWSSSEALRSRESRCVGVRKSCRRWCHRV